MQVENGEEPQIIQDLNESMESVGENDILTNENEEVEENMFSFDNDMTGELDEDGMKKESYKDENIILINIKHTDIVNDFGVNIIPHTKAVTTWRNAKVYDFVNLEIDTLERYVARLKDWN